MAEPETDVDARVPWDAVGFVLASRYRVATLRYLVDEGHGRPSTVTEETLIPDISHTSRALRELREHDPALAELRIDRPKYRLHVPTDAGRRVMATIRDEGLYEPDDGGLDDG